MEGSKCALRGVGASSGRCSNLAQISIRTKKRVTFGDIYLPQDGCNSPASMSRCHSVLLSRQYIAASRKPDNLHPFLPFSPQRSLPSVLLPFFFFCGFVGDDGRHFLCPSLTTSCQQPNPSRRPEAIVSAPLRPTLHRPPPAARRPPPPPAARRPPPAARHPLGQCRRFADGAAHSPTQVGLAHVRVAFCVTTGGQAAARGSMRADHGCDCRVL